MPTVTLEVRTRGRRFSVDEHEIQEKFGDSLRIEVKPKVLVKAIDAEQVVLVVITMLGSIPADLASRWLWEKLKERNAVARVENEQSQIQDRETIERILRTVSERKPE